VVVSAKLTASEKAAKREREQVLKELQERFPNNPERVERELVRWRESQELAAEVAARAADDLRSWDALTEEQRDAWLSIYMDKSTAVRETGRIARLARQRSGEGMFSGSRPSRTAPLRARPRGGP
jgi:hypothetical protein